jgi:hypothetical protein
MRVVVVEMRTTATKLSREEVSEAAVHFGELFIESGVAYLCAGPRPNEWPEEGQILPPLYQAQVSRLRGDDLVIIGKYLKDGILVHATVPQAWWCRPAGPADAARTLDEPSGP